MSSIVGTSNGTHHHAACQWKRWTVNWRLDSYIIDLKAFLSHGLKEDCSHKTAGELFGKRGKFPQVYACTLNVTPGENPREHGVLYLESQTYFTLQGVSKIFL